MLIGLIISLLVAWAGFMGLAMSMLAGFQTDGMVVYGLILIIGGVAAKIFLEKSDL